MGNLLSCHSIGFRYAYIPIHLIVGWRVFNFVEYGFVQCRFTCFVGFNGFNRVIEGGRTVLIDRFGEALYEFDVVFDGAG